MNEADLLRNLGVLAAVGGVVFGGWFLKTVGRFILGGLLVLAAVGVIIWHVL